MTRFTIALAATMLASAASAHSSDVIISSGSAVHVSYGGLNLHSRQGRDQLAGRIRGAAAALCNDPNIDPLDVRLKRMDCYRVAVADGVSQMNAIAN
jgi:UrcA family protein